MPLSRMERFTITPVDDEKTDKFDGNVQKFRNEVAIDVSTLRNARRNSKTVPNFGADSRRISLAQLTRY